MRGEIGLPEPLGPVRPIIRGFPSFHLLPIPVSIASGENRDSPQQKGMVMTTSWNMRTAMSALLALSFVAGAASKVMAYENDNDRDTRNAKQFYQKLDAEQGGGG